MIGVFFFGVVISIVLDKIHPLKKDEHSHYQYNM